ncbi:unnamed protein product [Pylaiella littoralis]
MAKRCHAQLLLRRLPSFVQSIADFKHHEASLAILPDFQRDRTHDEFKDPWIAVVSPLLLFTHCEKLLMNCRLEDQLDEKLLQVNVDLNKVGEGLMGEHEEQQQQQDPRMIDARLEVPPQKILCHSVHCGGMLALENVLEFLRQLSIAVKVRLLLLGVWRRLILLRRHEDGLSLIEQVEAACRNKDTLDHDLIIPLRKSLEKELRVATAAAKVIDLHETGAPLRHLVSVMELRNAMIAWDRGHRAEGEFVIYRRLKAILLDTVEGNAARYGQQPAGNERTRILEEGSTKGLTRVEDREVGLSFSPPMAFAYSEGSLFDEAVVSGISGLDGNTGCFVFSIGVAKSM